jgi:hypothetical protein
MRLWPRRRSPAAPVRGHANATAIAVLEHDLLGITPKPGSAAALAVALRQAGACLTHQPAEVTSLSDRAPVAICVRCGHHMVQDGDGRWCIAGAATTEGD